MSSRGGGERPDDIVDTIERRGLKIAVVGIRKTIDNDLSFTEKSFGFETAVAIPIAGVTFSRRATSRSR